MECPKISVITVCYNAVSTIEKTILSVINQTYPNIEYIIIDGASTDGTIDIVNKYRDKITSFVSEPDKGIYDAMNKSLDILKGNFVIFMNSGDEFYDEKIVASVFYNYDRLKNVAVIYGDTKYKTRWGWYEKEAEDIGVMKIRCPFCHQSAFIDVKLMQLYKYDIKYRFAADYHFFYTLWRKGYKMIHVPVSISVFDSSIPSFSGKHSFRVRKEEMKISNSYSLQGILMFSIIFLKAFSAKALLYLPCSNYIRNKRFKANPLIKSYKIYS